MDKAFTPRIRTDTRSKYNKEKSIKRLTGRQRPKAKRWVKKWVRSNYSSMKIHKWIRVDNQYEMQMVSDESNDGDRNDNKSEKYQS
ncbi:hypothetical protein ACOME3_005015 [Neoechinorhynchus agilis]